MKPIKVYVQLSNKFKKMFVFPQIDSQGNKNKIKKSIEIQKTTHEYPDSEKLWISHLPVTNLFFFGMLLDCFMCAHPLRLQTIIIIANHFHYKA